MYAFQSPWLKTRAREDIESICHSTECSRYFYQQDRERSMRETSYEECLFFLCIVINLLSSTNTSCFQRSAWFRLLLSRVFVRPRYFSVSSILSFPENAIPISSVRVCWQPSSDNTGLRWSLGSSEISFYHARFCKARSKVGQWANSQSRASFCLDGILPIGRAELRRLVWHTCRARIYLGKILDFF